MSTASRIIRQKREELSKLSNEALEDILTVKIDFKPPGPDDWGRSFLLRQRLASDLLDVRYGRPKHPRTMSVWGVLKNSILSS
jgi:hypothetical protein